MAIQPTTALVTGGARRIGAAIARALGKNGIDVAVHYHRSQGDAHSVAAALRADGVRAVALDADLADPDAARHLVRRATEHLGPIGILINNAAIWQPSTLDTLSLDTLMHTIHVNTVVPLVLLRAFAETTRRGAVVNLLDCRILDNDRRHAAYHLSKRMLLDITRIAALELAPAIRVNGVAPGLILPPSGGDDSYLVSRKGSTPLQCVGTLSDITRTVMFLLENPSITGQVVYVDGGRHMNRAVY